MRQDRPAADGWGRTRLRPAATITALARTVSPWSVVRVKAPLVPLRPLTWRPSSRGAANGAIWSSSRVIRAPASIAGWAGMS